MANTPVQTYYKNLAETTMKNLTRRGFDACYAETTEEALTLAKSFIKPGSKVSNGGSVTLTEIGLMDAFKAEDKDFTYLDRKKPQTQEEQDAFWAQVFTCDTYFASCNAITTDGLLVNIDGTCNRVAAMLFGPKEVVLIAGMNKVCLDLDSAYKRVKMSAAPPNCNRLGRQTPCAVTGKCGDCLSPDCICTATVVTRRPNKPHRVKIILVGEALGY